MKKIILSIILIFFCQNIFAWQHGISCGYGFSPKNTQGYSNNGLFLNANLYKKPIDQTLILTADASLGRWRANTTENKNLTTLAVSGDLRAYFTKPQQQKLKPYLFLTAGPAYLSNKKFGAAEQGARYAFQITFGGGSEMLINQHEFSIDLRLVHYCNAGLAKPNRSVNILYLLSVGCLF